MIEIKSLKAYNSHAMKCISQNRGIKQRLIALLSCASILISAIAPAVSQTMMLDNQPLNEAGKLISQSTPFGMMKVCSSIGNKFIPVSFILSKANISPPEIIPNSSNKNSKTDLTSVCSYCDQYAGAQAAFAFAFHGAALEKTSQQYATTFYLNPRSYLLKSPSSPRGPPSQFL